MGNILSRPKMVLFWSRGMNIPAIKAGLVDVIVL